MSNTYLIVYGQNVSRSKICYKETEINYEDLTNYIPLIKKIYENINKLENWTGGKTLNYKNGKYNEYNHLYEMYPEFDHKLLDKFSEYLPNGITHIDFIKIFKG